MKRTMYLATGLILILLLAGCVNAPVITPPAEPSPIPLTDVPTTVPTLAPMPTNTMVIPTATAEVKLDRAQIGMFAPVNLSYDPAIWTVKLDDNYTDQSGNKVAKLVLTGNEECVIQDNLGHGMGDDWEQKQVEKKLGDQTFTVYQWIYKPSGTPELVVYESGNYRIEVLARADSMKCLEEAEKVLAQTNGKYE
ncbi:MAG TPA: hypothetical protein PKD55_12510 [Bellilinea sp.]|nr:hypothetical protein [Bellilinea sp.]